MIKLIIFDLDGVLVDSKETHYEALNMALRKIDKKYEISHEDHIIYYDGIPTSEKLLLLTNKKGLDKKHYKKIWRLKQKYTSKLIDKTHRSEKLIEICEMLKSYDIEIAIASNSIKKTVVKYLKKIGIYKYFDYIYSNEDVKNTKPNPEIYWRCMISSGCYPQAALIVEDSHVGIRGASLSGARVLTVKNTNDLTKEKILSAIMKEGVNIMHKSDINILIPMAGNGSRFADAGYTFPKPIIDVKGKPMIARVVENIGIEGNHIFIIRKEHQEKYNIRSMLSVISPNCKIIEQSETLKGAAHTTLLAKEFINNDKPLIIANSDQLIKYSAIDWLYYCDAGNSDGCILTFKNTHPKWSYAEIDLENNVTRVAEKEVISTNATVGIYYWRKGSDYVKYAEQMIKQNITTRGEYYVCPVYNQAIKDGKKIKIFHVEKMQGIGTPEDLEEYLRS